MEDKELEVNDAEEKASTRTKDMDPREKHKTRMLSLCALP